MCEIGVTFLRCSKMKVLLSLVPWAAPASMKKPLRFFLEGFRG